jgi:hypothetical protein
MPARDRAYPSGVGKHAFAARGGPGYAEPDRAAKAWHPAWYRMDRYNPARDVTSAFLERVSEWIQRSGEVLVILRYLRAAGAKDFALCRTRGDFERLVESVPTGTDIEVFRDPQLPLRGTVDEALIASALIAIPYGEEYLLVTTEVRPGSNISRFGDIGCSHADLRESLEELMGADVALGACPAYCVPDHEGLISAAKGGIDGPR